MSETALSTELRPVENKLAEFSSYVAAVVVKTPEQYKEVCERIVSARGEIKKIGFVLDPGIESARSHLDTLRNQKKGFVMRWEQEIETGAQKAEGWKRAEREATDREQQRVRQQAETAARIKAEEERREADRIAKEQREARERELEAQLKAGEIGKREQERLRKQAAEEEARARELAAKQAQETAAAIPEVKVQSAVPKISGIKARVNWKFRVTSPTLVPRIYCIPDEVAIGQMVRTVKDKAKIEALIPGIEVWSEDGI